MNTPKGVRKLYVKPMEADRFPENHSVSVTTGGFSDVSITLEWFKERLYRVATKDIISKAEFAYAIKYYEVLVDIANWSFTLSVIS